MKRFLRVLFGLGFLFLFLTKQVAADDFVSFFNVAYDFNEDGSCNVNYSIKIKNLSSDVYVSRYSITIGSGEVSDVYFSDGEGQLDASISRFERATKVDVNLNEKVAGVDKILTLNLSFKAIDFAEKNGQVWEINLPGLSENSNYGSYQVRVGAPISFGKVLYVSPKPKSYLSWGQNELGEEGITIYFGEIQVFDYDLTYYLENSEDERVLDTIALPPDTVYQKVFLYTLDPKPREIYRDDEGNWLADYVLEENQTLVVKATGSAEVYWNKRDDFVQPKLEMEKYLEAREYWEVNERRIKELANELGSVRSIYNFILEKLDYDYERAVNDAKRLGAVAALDNPSKAICMEYTDLFIALARAAGIAAREVDGYAYTENPKLAGLEEHTDVLHTWPEYYDEKLEIFRPVDPTWEDSSFMDYFNKFDLYHLVFVIRGQESTYPYPAGSYKDKKMRKTVKVEFGEIKNAVKPGEQVEIEVKKGDSYISGIDQTVELRVYNNGPTAFYNLEFEAEGSDFYLIDDKRAVKKMTLKAGDLLPFEEVDVRVRVVKKGFSKIGENELKLNYLKKEDVVKIYFEPVYFKYIYVFILLGVSSGAVFVYIAKKTWRLFSERRKR